MFASLLALGLSLVAQDTIPPDAPSPAGTFTVDGDKKPSQLTSTFQAVCGNHLIYVSVTNKPDKTTELHDVIIDSYNVTNAPEFDELRAFLSTIQYPSLSAVSCPANAVSFGLAGRPTTGDNTFYRITIPLDRWKGDVPPAANSAKPG